MPYQAIVSVTIPAMASPTGWVRASKTFSISSGTPNWMVKMLEGFIRGK